MEGAVGAIGAKDVPVDLGLEGILIGELIMIISSPTLRRIVVVHVNVLQVIESFPRPRTGNSLVSLGLYLRITMRRTMTIQSSINGVLVRGFVSLFIVLRELVGEC